MSAAVISAGLCSMARRDVVQDAQRLFGRGGFDQHALEPALERGVALDVLAVFVERRGADGLHFAPRQRGLEDVGRVEASLRGAGADDGVDLVDEKDRVLRLAQFVEQLLHPLLELAAELRAGDQRRDVEREECLPGQRIGHLARRDAQRQPLDDGALAHARLADQDRVVLLAARKDLDHALDLPVAPYHGVDPAFARLPREVDAELFEQLRRGALFGLVLVVEVEHAHLDAGAELVARSEFPQLLGHRFGRDAVHLQHARGRRRAVAHDPLQGVAGRDAADAFGMLPQLFGEILEKALGLLCLALFRFGLQHLAFEAQTDLVELPVFQAGGQYLIGERTLFAQQFQHEDVLERVGGIRLRRVERGPGEDAFERF